MITKLVKSNVKFLKKRFLTSQKFIYFLFIYLLFVFGFFSESRIQGAPGTGQLSRSVSRGRQNTSPRANTPLDNEILKPVLKKTVTEVRHSLSDKAI